jgi:hypothetical protein
MPVFFFALKTPAKTPAKTPSQSPSQTPTKPNPKPLQPTHPQPNQTPSNPKSPQPSQPQITSTHPTPTQSNPNTATPQINPAKPNPSQIQPKSLQPSRGFGSVMPQGLGMPHPIRNPIRNPIRRNKAEPRPHRLAGHRPPSSNLGTTSNARSDPIPGSEHRWARCTPGWGAPTQATKGVGSVRGAQGKHR